MKAKFFVLASVIALPGAVASIAMQGCSSDSNTTPDPVVEAGPGDSGKVNPPKDSAPEPEPDTGPKTCPSDTPITVADLPLKWQPPPAIDNECTQADIDKLKAAFKSSTTGGVKFSDIKTALGTTCSACVFSPFSADGGAANTEWSVFVELDAGTAVDNRSGSCFAHLKSETCGRTRYQFESCLRVGCTTTECGSDSAVTKCKQDIQSGACKAITDEYVAACPEETDLIAACNVYASIATGCAGGPDAGIDSSAP